MLKKLREISIADKATSLFQSAVSEYNSQLDSKEQLDSVIIKGVSLVSGSPNKVAHKLGRDFLGWHVVDVDSNVTVWRDTAAISDKNLFLTLRTSGACTVNILVY